MKKNINSTIKEIEARVSELSAEVGNLARQRRALLVNILRADTEEEKDALTTQATDLLQRQATVQIDLADWRGALDDVVDRRDTLNAEANAKVEQKSIETCKALFVTAIEKAALVDRLMGELGAATHDFEKAQEKANNAATPALRASELRDYAQHKSACEPLRKLRLGFEGVLRGTGPLDKTEQPRTLADQMRLAVGDLLPPPEAPEKETA